MTAAPPIQSFLFADHDIQNHVVCILHADGAYLSQVHDGLLDVFLNDAVVLRDAGAFHGKDCRLDGSGDSGGHFQGAADLGPVTYHSGDVAYHVLDGCAYLGVAASTEPCDAAG